MTIKVVNIHKRFGKYPVLKGFNLNIDKGGIYAILGPNGSGKTTLIKTILGMVIANKGIVYIDGKNSKKRWKYRNHINYLPQIANFPANLSVKELIRMIKDLRNKPAKDKDLLTLFNLKPFLNKKLNILSGGTKQKVNLVLAFMFDSPIIILDEPTTGLEPAALISLKELIAQEKLKGKTILITSHIMSFVEEMADEIVFLLEGEVYFKGTAKMLKTKTNETNFEYAIAKLETLN